MSTGIKITVSDSGYNDTLLCLRWMQEVFEPETARRMTSPGAWRMLVLDGHECHLSLPLLQWIKQRKIVLACLPVHTSHLF